MATTAMRHTDAHPVATMGRAIFMAASSWAWAPGRTGVMAMAGVHTVSAAVEEELMSEVEGTAAGHMQPTMHKPTARPPRVAPMPQQLMKPPMAGNLTGAKDTTSHC
jgi:hypothetical protein